MGLCLYSVLLTEWTNDCQRVENIPMNVRVEELVHLINNVPQSPISTLWLGYPETASTARSTSSSNETISARRASESCSLITRRAFTGSKVANVISSSVAISLKPYPSVSEDYCEIGLRQESYGWGISRRGAFLFRQGVSRYWQRVTNLARRPTH